MNFIEQQGLAGHIFHPQVFGDYLIWRLWPKQKSFVDGRVHLFGPDLFRESGVLLYNSRWEDMPASWDIQYILLNKAGDNDTVKTIASTRTSTRWTKLYEDDISILFEKNHVTPPL